MVRIQRSALFKRQVINLTKGYRDRAGSTVAHGFVDQVEEAIRFVSAKPLACAVYTRLQGKAFRKQTLRRFPVSLFFRIEAEDTIVLEALYPHRMDIGGRLPNEID